MHNLAVLVHDSPLGEGLLAVRAGWGKPADRGVLRVGVDRIGLLALTALLERKYFFSSGSLKGFATFWEFSFYGQKKVADYEYHSPFAEKNHFQT